MFNSCPSPSDSHCLLRKLATTDADNDCETNCLACQSSVDELEQQIFGVGQKLKEASEVPADVHLAEEGFDRAQRLAISVEAATTRVPELPEIDGYDVLDLLGRGGMGAVYRAIHIASGSIVALKVLPPNAVADEKVIARFRREMRTIRQLDHENIVAAIDAGESEGIHYLVMEHVEGVDLSALVNRIGPLDVADACELVRQAAIGLQHAYSQGIVHRDVKPSNMMLAKSEDAKATRSTVKLLDLGVAMLNRESTSESSARELTGTGQVIGTIDYMAPEQCRNSRQVDIRADVYALGATLYKLLSGCTPFHECQGRPFYERIVTLIEEKPRSVGSRRPDLPRSLVQLIDRLLDKDPNRRCDTPGKVAKALGPFAKHHRIDCLLQEYADAPQETKNELTEAFDSSSTRHDSVAANLSSRPFSPWYWGIGVLAVFAVGGLLAWQWSHAGGGSSVALVIEDGDYMIRNRFALGATLTCPANREDDLAILNLDEGMEEVRNAELVWRIERHSGDLKIDFQPQPSHGRFLGLFSIRNQASGRLLSFDKQPLAENDGMLPIVVHGARDEHASGEQPAKLWAFYQHTGRAPVGPETARTIDVVHWILIQNVASEQLLIAAPSRVDSDTMRAVLFGDYSGWGESEENPQKMWALIPLVDKPTHP